MACFGGLGRFFPVCRFFVVVFIVVIIILGVIFELSSSEPVGPVIAVAAVGVI